LEQLSNLADSEAFSLFGALGVPLHGCAHEGIRTVLQSIGATAANERTGPEIRQASSIAHLAV
jgi:hypothetical protein